MDQTSRPSRVSITIASYNRGRFLPEALESILAQSFADWEAIIVDDGSTDNTREIVEPYLKDPRISYLKNEKNLGISLTRNRGLEASRGELVAVLDSDDTWSDPDKLGKQVRFLDEHPGHALVGTAVNIIDAEGRPLKRYRNPLSDEAVRRTILSKNAFAHSSVLYRKSAIETVGAYDPSINGIEDYDLWLRIGEKFKFANLPDYAIKYRVHGANISATDRSRLIRIHLELIRKHHQAYSRYWLALLRRHAALWANKIFRSVSY